MLGLLTYDQPISSILALLLLCGLIFISESFSKIFFNKNDLLDRATSYALTLLLVSFFSGLVVHKIIPILMLKLVGYLIIFLGIFQISVMISRFRIFIQENKLYFEYKSSLKIILVLTLILLFILALTPPTDADSLDYHLGVPAYWVLNQGFDPLEQWFHARLVGPGEDLIFLGLIIGTDSFSALLQWSGILLAIFALASFSRNHVEGVFLAGLIVLSPILIIFLTMNQKPYLLPASLIVLSISIIHNKIHHDKKYLYLASILLLYTSLHKYSFILTVTPVFIYLFYKSWQISKLKKIIYFSILAFCIISLPHYLSNFIHYGDPISPLLSKVFNPGNIQLIEFKNNLTGEYSPSLSSILNVPFDQGFLPKRFDHITVIIGVGWIVAFLGFSFKSSAVKELTILFFSILCLILILGRPISRLMLELYFLGGAIYILSNKEKFFLFAKFALGGQLLLVFSLTVITLYNMLPGVINEENKNKVLKEFANGFSISKEIDGHLNSEDFLLTNIRSKILFKSNVAFVDSIDYADQSNTEKIILEIDAKRKITHVALKMPVSKNYEKLKLCSKKGSEREIEYMTGTRNPLNKTLRKIKFFEIDRFNSCFLED